MNAHNGDAYLFMSKTRRTVALSQSLDNATEHAIRPCTVHRKNAVSYGSEDGVKEACVFLTLCETCKQYGINFKEYITHAVKEIINGNTNYETLVPWAIKLA